MKRTELERRERELKKAQKKILKLSEKNVDTGCLISKLFSLFQYDEDEIFNIPRNDKILEFMIEMQEILSDKEMQNIMRKAIKKTKIQEKQKAFNDLVALME